MNASVQKRSATSPARDILVVGGYGVVGRRIAARLAPLFQGRVVVAGRDERKAATLCGELGEGARARRIDVDDPASIAAALEGVGTVLSCVAQRDLHLLRAAIAGGMAYTDIAPRLAFWQVAEDMASEARRTGARVVLGAGLSPGISYVMAARLAKTVGRVRPRQPWRHRSSEAAPRGPGPLRARGHRRGRRARDENDR